VNDTSLNFAKGKVQRGVVRQQEDYNARCIQIATLKHLRHKTMHIIISVISRLLEFLKAPWVTHKMYNPIVDN